MKNDKKGISLPIIHGEIQYTNAEGLGVHSDFGTLPAPAPDHRKFLHALLDEWLDKSGGTGYFFLGDPPDSED